MAISNIFREPRREITETLVGASVLATFLVVDYCFGCWFASRGFPDEDKLGATILGMFIGAGFSFLTSRMIAIAHGIGDTICNHLQARGLYLRPRRRT